MIQGEMIAVFRCIYKLLDQQNLKIEQYATKMYIQPRSNEISSILSGLKISRAQSRCARFYD